MNIVSYTLLFLAMLPVKTDLPHEMFRLCPGARRSFFCRMKCRASSTQTQTNESTDMTSGYYHSNKQTNSDKKYVVVQCSGYLKSKIGIDDQEMDADGESCNMTCLVAVAKIPLTTLKFNQSSGVTTNARLKPVQFTSRHATDGKFLFVDHRYIQYFVCLLIFQIFQEQKSFSHTNKIQYRSFVNVNFWFILQGHIGAWFFITGAARNQRLWVLSAWWHCWLGWSAQNCIANKWQNHHGHLSFPHQRQWLHTRTNRVEIVQESMDQRYRIFDCQKYSYIVINISFFQYQYALLE